MNVEEYSEREVGVLHGKNTRYRISALASAIIVTCQDE
jgi:hypothetical protein